MTTAVAAPGIPERGLAQQGYDYSPAELRQLSWALRFTPFLCMLGALYGLWTRQPLVHFLLGATGIIPMWFPAGHPFDRIYNHLLRPLWNGVRLPPNPLPRRVACVAGGSMNVAIGLGFLYDAPAVAYTFGAILVPLQLIVISTHFCVASWLYEVALRLFGVWTAPIAPARARELVAAGAQLVDVRDADEYARGHIAGAVNLPVDGIEQRLEALRGKPVVLYCASGLRSQKAWQVLARRHGLQQVYNLGGMTRWG